MDKKPQAIYNPDFVVILRDEQIVYVQGLIAENSKLREQLKMAKEAISNWKTQVDNYGGDYLPVHYRQLTDALSKLGEDV